ncbi:hypothetical protein V6N12_041789 [Hibiscus sabdariffa]|uniref:Uncharacterized protein n=1 Tax=Hibiscus sabdariffa TaxID=183260 RepID=A0ABR2AWU5_9ROSI
MAAAATPGLARQRQKWRRHTLNSLRHGGSPTPENQANPGDTTHGLKHLKKTHLQTKHPERKLLQTQSVERTARL